MVVKCGKLAVFHFMKKVKGSKQQHLLGTFFEYTRSIRYRISSG